MVARLMLAASVLLVRAWGTGCPDDPEVDLCSETTTDESGTGTGTEEVNVNGAMRARTSLMPMLLLAGVFRSKNALFALPLLGGPLAAEAAAAAGTSGPSTCGAVKDMYKEQGCCGRPDKELDVVIVPKPTKRLFGANICEGKQPVHATPGDNYFKNVDCLNGTTLQVLEQAGANVTLGYQGTIDASSRTPILTPYWQNGLCPVNVHWHLGTEHYSKGQFDEHGTGPDIAAEEDAEGEADSRRLAVARRGYRCSKYDAKDAKFTTEYNWQHCEGMHVGETYEVHWPHSAAGACGTPYQYQTPFYDGVFCVDGIVSLSPLNTYMKIGVQSQVYTIVNDETYYYPEMIKGMIVDGHYGQDIAKYTGSTTGTSRDNEVCSRYTPITWQVDRKCHLISASSFDKMCADMKNQHDDMSSDLHAHGSRVLVDRNFTGNNFHRRM
mmetsp:Transcript_98508/g.298964  ORF Transcript_98508/g.298964 Transcript_98508/m.298964 type:complete len:438 (-) Transcript_98508:176-1489(-)